MSKYYCYIVENIFEHIESKKLILTTKSKRLMRTFRKQNEHRKYIIKYGKSEKESYTLDSYEYRTKRTSRDIPK